MTTVAFTGPATIKGMRIVREDLIALATAHGYRVVGGVSRGVDYLVTCTPDSGSRKNRAAQQYGTAVITPEQFLHLCGGQIEIRHKDL